MADITQDFLKSILHYNPATGVFTWRKRPREHFATARIYNSWNMKHAGKIAGGLTAKSKYWGLRINSKLYLAHRLAWRYVTGVWPEHELDHINCNRTDNRMANLREATHSENVKNTPMRKTNTSGYKGVTWHKHTGKWAAQIKVNSKHIHLGIFDTPEEAHAAYCEAAKKYHGLFAKIG